MNKFIKKWTESSLILKILIGLIIGGIDFSKLVIKVKDAEIGYGLFIQNVVDFLIVALCIFMVVKLFSKFKKKKEEEPEAPAEPSEEVLLLREIRDSLKKHK